MLRAAEHGPPLLGVGASEEEEEGVTLKFSATIRAPLLVTAPLQRTGERLIINTVIGIISVLISNTCNHKCNHRDTLCHSAVVIRVALFFLRRITITGLVKLTSLISIQINMSVK